MKGSIRERLRFLAGLLPVAVIALSIHTMAAESSLEEQTTETANTEEVISETNTTTATENTETDDTEDQESEDTTEDYRAGAAVILDADYAMDATALQQLVEENTLAVEETVETEEPEEEETSDLVMAKVNEYVNIRETAEADAEVLGLLYKDCGGTLLEQESGWSKISSGDVEGWVKDDYLYFGDEAEQNAKEVGMLTAVTNTETLRVRKDADENAGIYGLLAFRESVEAIDVQDDWVVIDFEGNTGYVSKDFVDVNFNIDEAESMAAIKEREQKAAEEKAKRNQQKAAVAATASEEDILAALIQCEAGGESFEGQVAVGAVVMNRVRSGGYPGSISDVIYASGQFSPASSGKMDNLIMNGSIKESCRQAARETINGTSNVGDATHFKRAGAAQGFQIGNHVFY